MRKYGIWSYHTWVGNCLPSFYGPVVNQVYFYGNVSLCLIMCVCFISLITVPGTSLLCRMPKEKVLKTRRLTTTQNMVVKYSSMISQVFLVISCIPGTLIDCTTFFFESQQIFAIQVIFDLYVQLEALPSYLGWMEIPLFQPKKSLCKSNL